MWGFQLWLNLPAAHKMDEPAYQDIAPDSIPLVRRADGVQARVIAGSFAGDDGTPVQGPVRERPTQPTYLDLTVPAGQTFHWTAPAGQTVLVHGIEGEFGVGPNATPLRPHRMAILRASDATVLRVQAGATPARFLIIAARPLHEPVAHYGPFVMNTREEVMQAMQDYQAGLF